MKRIYIYAGVIAMMAASCSTDDSSTGGYVSGSKVTLNASFSNSDTRVTETASTTNGLVTAWSDDDSLDVLVNTNALVSMTKSTGNTFTATPANATVGSGFNAGKVIYGVNNKYNDKITTALNSSQLKATVDFTGQNGTVDNLKKYDLMYGKGDPTGNIRFKHKICVLCLDINSDSLKADGITSITGLKLKYVATSGTNSTKLFATQEVYNFGATCDSTITDADSIYVNNTSITVVDGKATVYIAIPHRQNLYGTLNIMLKGSNGTVGRFYNLTNSLSLSNVSMLMSTVHHQAITGLSRAAKVNTGNYLFNDGSWGYLADNLDSSKPIAVIFSKATSTTDKTNGWSHGYAMALKNASTSATWGPTGTNPTGTSITSTAAMIADKDGYTHTTYLNSSTYPAAYAAATTYQSTVAAPGNTSGWYLPSVGQWFDICVNLGKLSATGYTGSSSVVWASAATTCMNNLNASLTPLASGSYDTFTAGGYYWCSSESSNSTNAYYALFISNSNMTLGDMYKPIACSARGVIAF